MNFAPILEKSILDIFWIAFFVKEKFLAENYLS